MIRGPAVERFQAFTRFEEEIADFQKRTLRRTYVVPPAQLFLHVPAWPTFILVHPISIAKPLVIAVALYPVEYLASVGDSYPPLLGFFPLRLSFVLLPNLWFSHPTDTGIMFRLTSETQEALEAVVIQASAEHERVSYRSNGIYRRTFCLGDHDYSYPDLFIKYNDNGTQRSEAEMLQHIYTLACNDGDAALHGERTLVYLVMRHIEQANVAPDVLVAKTASVVQWLRSKRYTTDEPFGILPNSLVYHKLFKDRKAPFAFTNVSAVEKYLNTSDMDESNFGVASDDRGILFDAATIRGLSLSFADYTLLRTTPFAKAVAECLVDPVEMEERLCSSNMKSFVEVGRQLRWTYDDELGLDADGNVNFSTLSTSTLQVVTIESL
ncbi:hypothetical protein SISNIDRAFT_516278 [Sistotremastrum niveocremeum HHB9708]|uniref:Uncharacterized protein n=1 Tax=Sistotremastrum niveocremeum HHB9708 TaxID=1314777 RepID=A0A164SMD2_9AGAM|nr:hypothetical protein SISNIDRAFT_516278 [Sistotremastrum niveocremeum HHB9708]